MKSTSEKALKTLFLQAGHNVIIQILKPGHKYIIVFDSDQKLSVKCWGAPQYIFYEIIMGCV